MKAIGRLGQIVLSGLDWLGGLTQMAFTILRAGPRRPWGIDDIAAQMVHQGVRSLPIATFMSLFIGMILAWQFGYALKDFGATMALGDASSLALVRELVPTLVALTVGAKMAAGMTAELGSMKVTEQIDAVAALGADPIKKLAWPRVVAATFSQPLLVVWGNLLALLGGMLIGEWIFGVPAGYFYETYVEELAPLDYISSLVKATTFGMLVGLIGCYQGFNTKFGTEAVGAATTETVVAISICIIIADFYLTMVFS
ncbi:MAG: ABC transporter permease [Deltaproteobacteria bacterium]|jgi:phospholipid/cholesterol/gamma-HCH transport system permease protein|nr:ABC transporter permease [Deltaproteobacteria bacterium]